MYRLDEINTSLANVVGWRQNYDLANQIDEGLTESESGLYFQDAHPLMTLANMESIMPDDFYLKYPIWEASASYEKGTIVRVGATSVWKAKADNVAQQPEEGAYWTAFNPLSDFLADLTQRGINQVVQTFTQIKGLQHETRNLFERKTLFDGSGRINAAIENKGKLVGFEFVPVRAMGVTAKIERVGLQFTGGTGTVRLYLFHSSQIDPIKTYDLAYTREGSFQWFTLADCYMPYISDDNNAGGSWYLCYNQNDLPNYMEGINVSKDWSREPCGTCNIGSIETWRTITKYLQVSPFRKSAPTTFAQYPEMWDIEENDYTNTTSYGLNCEVTVGCDLTDFVTQQRQIFATVIQRQVAAIALRTLAMNPDVRVNRNQSNASRMEILYEIDGASQGRPNGLGYDLKEAYKALSIDTTGLDRMCLACQNYGVNYTTV